MIYTTAALVFMATSAFAGYGNDTSTHGCQFGPAPEKADSYRSITKLDQTAYTKDGQTRWAAKSEKMETWWMTAAAKGGEVQLGHNIVDTHESLYLATIQVEAESSNELPKGSKSLGQGLYELHLYLEPRPDKAEACYIESFAPTIKSITIQKHIEGTKLQARRVRHRVRPSRARPPVRVRISP